MKRGKGRKSSGEQRARAEAQGRYIDPDRTARRQREAEEEQRWASLAGPVEVRRVDDADNGRS